MSELAINYGVRDPELRFLRGIEWGEPSAHRPDLGPCLLHIGGDNGNGYVQFAYGGRNNYAHRYAWEREKGTIPDGLTVDHLCRVRRCVNITHLELVTGPENTRRGAQARPKATHCTKRNHDISVVGRASDGTCRACARVREEARWARERKGPPGVDIRIKYDQELKASLAIDAVERRLTVREAAQALGCSLKYMDKLVGREARARGIANRRYE